MNKTGQLSQRFRNAIEQGHLRAGDRMPSLRKVCQDHKISITTAQRAYAELEKLGLIEALPRSGFRVLARSQPLIGDAPLGGDGSAIRIEHLTSALPMPWGCPYMNPALINTTPLNRALTRALRDYRYALCGDTSMGFEGLRRELSLRYLAQGVELDGDELIVTCGGMEALNLAIRAVTKLSGSASVLALTPAFPALFDQLEQLGIAVHTLTVSPGQALDFSRLEQMILQHQPAAVLAMANFQHPTGLVWSDADKQALVALADKHRLPIIEDDTYRELHFGEGAPLPLKAFDQKGGVLHCSSFSKSLAPGYRVGWIAAGRFRDSIVGLKLCSSLSTPLPSQMALSRLLAGGQHEDMLSLLRSRLQSNLLALQQQLSTRLPTGTRLVTPQGGYFLWLELPEGMDCRSRLPQAMQQGIHYAPGSLFFRDAQARLNAMRLNISYFDPLQHHNGVAMLAELLS
ncbi:PLP-dependent aminotransferase family protein [Chromobacterium sp. IIBBL 290-4]|uniref:aminotransferase-like domain-containing protein n=1 Tax=Chromobacterium sp. IIBBL 290-4 TaxID=2953890 RepID=UPI0020B7B4C2|nr:PLP-dependent aminotransferase family protein [Chromobacterium sp. IIBBL 290-4]UTH74646.1 PLP-dependent aminotransferase family protein [Chromobacterium sp. IIBBL 290-4]